MTSSPLVAALYLVAASIVTWTILAVSQNDFLAYNSATIASFRAGLAWLWPTLRSVGRDYGKRRYYRVPGKPAWLVRELFWVAREFCRGYREQHEELLQQLTRVLVPNCRKQEVA